MSRQYQVVDVFTGTPFRGNPAAVVLDAEGLNDVHMQAVASEFNLSETTFVLPPDDAPGDPAGKHRVRFRWFTPGAEVDMCGHATIAGLHALVESGRIPEPQGADASTIVTIETRGGVLTGFVERMPGSQARRLIWLQLVTPRLEDVPVAFDALAAILNVHADTFDPALPPKRTQDHDLIAFVRDFTTLNDVHPDPRALATWLNEHRLRGLTLATIRTITPSIHVQSRFFAPNYGIAEDPVTGSVHGPLAAYLAAAGIAPQHDGVAALSCLQGIPGGRAGQVHALVGRAADGRQWARIGGSTVTTMRGALL